MHLFFPRLPQSLGKEESNVKKGKRQQRLRIHSTASLHRAEVSRNVSENQGFASC